MIKRAVFEDILGRLTNEKIILVFGARQVGKSTLLKSVLQNQQAPHYWMNADDPFVQALFTNFSVAAFQALIGTATVVVIDEAQQLPDIGKKLKLLFDSNINCQLLATGSSAFELRNNTSEPLTGRKWEYHLFPISFGEMATHTNKLQEIQALHQRLQFGYYPDVVTHLPEAKERLQLIMDSYLYKDVLMWQGLKKPEKILQLLKALAMQIGQEVNYTELGKMLSLSRDTIEKYITVLEQSYVVFKLSSYSTNARKELTKAKKIYFLDVGIRNALIGDFRPMAMRQDAGSVWENYVIAELYKQNQYSKAYGRFYFWRTVNQQEIDLIIEKEGTLFCYEIKWNSHARARLSKTFIQQYPNHRFAIVHPENYWQFL